jgi:uncharacterized damage-inducible protein DinB
MRTTELQELYEFNRWANARVLNAASKLSVDEFARDLGNSFPSVGATLAHILAAEWIWLQRWLGSSPRAMPAGWSSMGAADLRQTWETVEAEQTRFIMAINETDLDRVISYINLAGLSYSYPLWQMLRHVVNHSTYHRGQIITMLRQMGAQIIGTDLLIFYDEKTPRP